LSHFTRAGATSFRYDDRSFLAVANQLMRKRSVAADSVAAHADDLFRSRLENQIDLRHPLAKLASRMPWTDLEDALAPTLPPDPERGGRPALPVRLMAGLLYLKHAYDLSDEAVCERWLENPYWQFFTGEVVFQTALPCNPSSLTRWRQRLGEAGMEELLARKAGRHAHAHQFKRMRRVLRRQRTLLGRVIRDIGRQLDQLPQTAREQMQVWLARADRIFRQKPKDKNKLYALHAPEVECI